MKLIIAIVQRKDANPLIDSLTEGGFKVTKIASTGGFLKSGNTTLLVGVEQQEVDNVISRIKEKCKGETKSVETEDSLAKSIKTYDSYSDKKEVKVGGATVFVIDVDKFKKV
ncbi:cyclic-di-AMP receptor [Clostridium sp. CX1]|uniref:Cyclic-di-AMP receptor n=1 Tax=Clostridium tanneri TaxID=3037988 RepID=A0ABU4JRQ5_9CLOT|nr:MULTISPECIES: cyclic-di-AMP receptor [unclassified Clostridium]MCT8977814.1 cyclic-di-AMP receptor [Clostridium sp. CX1]MDW8800831.1 cyclic-di-AMP receptor [Clostridium sp. A1-XYC3]